MKKTSLFFTLLLVGCAVPAPLSSPASPWPWTQPITTGQRIYHLPPDFYDSTDQALDDHGNIYFKR